MNYSFQPANRNLEDEDLGQDAEKDQGRFTFETGTAQGAPGKNSFLSISQAAMLKSELFCFAVLRVEPWALCMLGKGSTTEPYPGQVRSALGDL